MANLAIRGHATRGKEVIEILEMLGGVNQYEIPIAKEDLLYAIRSHDKFIIGVYPTNTFIVFTLEEFLEKFPYKVGDKAFAFDNKCTIIDAVWDEGIDEVVYTIKLDTSKYTTTKLSNQLQPYKEETIDKANKAVFDANTQCCDIMNRLIKEETMKKIIKIDIPKGYEFAGFDDDKQQIVFEKIVCQYPKTYEECCDVLEIKYSSYCVGYQEELLDNFQQLIVCRDAYWKLAGDWKPDWDNNRTKYIITVAENKIYTDVTYIFNYVLCFPTKEMRDKFFENFKDLIIECKELL